jgi:hypothetical protein
MNNLSEHFIIVAKIAKWDLHLHYTKNETQKSRDEPDVSEVFLTQCEILYSDGTKHKKGEILDLRIYTNYDYMLWDLRKDKKFVDDEKPDSINASINYYEFMRRKYDAQKRIDGGIFDKNIALIHVPKEISDRIASRMCNYVEILGRVGIDKKYLPIHSLSFYTDIDITDWTG